MLTDTTRDTSRSTIPKYEIVACQAIFLNACGILSTILCAASFVAMSMLTSVSGTAAENYRATLFAATMVLLSSSIWNIISAVICSWLSKEAASREGGRETIYEIILGQIVYIFGGVLFLAGIIMFITASYYLASVFVESYAMGKVAPLVIIIPAGTTTLLIILVTLGFFIK